MLNKLRSKQGFTLIELLIVVAIIGILAAIAIPQFSAYQKRGYASAARSDARNVHTSIKALFADNVGAAKVSDLPGPPTTGSVLSGGAVIGSTHLSNGVVMQLTDGTEDTYTICASHLKLDPHDVGTAGSGGTYTLLGTGSVTDSLSLGF